MANPIEELASKAMGAAKLGKATLEGLTGVFRTLAKEHGEVAALLMRVKASSDPHVRAQLFPEIRRELLAHEKSELTVVYPAFRRYEEMRRIADEHDMQAGQLGKMIGEIEPLAYNDPAWDTKFDALVDLVQRHVAFEEHDYFPKAEKVMDSKETEALRAQYESVKAEVATQLA